ncbi:MAG: hypothetical protein CM1200mP15_21100 [Dehalococcoidia bacterium]|nr:MAG: hypothetical protein CM1200mP15_21100 [Dehalococcoidia bacterium]
MAAQGASVLIVYMDEANAVKTVSQIHEFEGIGSIFIGDVTDVSHEQYGKYCIRTIWQNRCAR